MPIIIPPTNPDDDVNLQECCLTDDQGSFPCKEHKETSFNTISDAANKYYTEKIRNMEKQAMDGQTLLTGTKKDEGKARWDLLPFEVIDAVARILTRGAGKYSPRNWEKGIAYGRVFAGVMRHLMEFWMCKLFGRDGINHSDGPESHIDHAITGLMFLSAYEKRGMTAFDDRPTAETK